MYGGIGAAVSSALVFPMYGLQTVLGAIGAGEEDGDVEVSCATSPLACHANVGAGERYLFLRSMSALYKGASLCDHPNDIKVGSVAYIQRLRDAGTSFRDVWSIAAMGVGIGGQLPRHRRGTKFWCSSKCTRANKMVLFPGILTLTLHDSLWVVNILGELECQSGVLDLFIFLLSFLVVF